MLHDEFPDKWAKLKEWDAQTYNSFRNDYKLQALDIAFRRINESSESIELTDKYFGG